MAPTDSRHTRSPGEAVMARLEELARFSTDRTALTRLYLSAEHKSAAKQTQVWMQEAGMEARIDAVANVVGRHEGREPGLPALLLGSHIDTVRNAGKYDGCFGVIAAIEAVSALHAAGERLPFAIEVIAFGDEEGVRFPVTLTGSRAIAGTLDPATLDAMDADRISIRQALQQFGCAPIDDPRVSRRRQQALAYCELHTEQGPVLETEKLPLGLVTAISGASRFAITVEGVAGHAGTVPMQLRQDALCAAAEMILAIEHLAGETDQLVATVGCIEALPGAANVIPSSSRFTLDIRSPSDRVRADAIGRLEKAFEEIAGQRRVRLDVQRTYDEPAAGCHPALIEQLEAAVSRAGITPLRLPSGAGHDGLAMISLCPIAMLFVRCKGGISHNPAESISTADADTAVRVLIDFLHHFDPSRLRAN
ncbi:MAG: allantoate amidohydrolase [Alphaproteobacteria bacterium]|nr:allantoate amidohydrolase [Alphaproteobacteria bacterium]